MSNRAVHTSFDNPGVFADPLRPGQDHGEAQKGPWSTLYGELTNIARGILRRTGRGAGKDAASLVHKAYLRLRLNETKWNDRRHFLAVATRAMRFVLADEARRHLAKKRGAGDTRPLEVLSRQVAEPKASPTEEVLSIHQALAALAEVHPRNEKLVKLRYFAGLSVEETARALEVTPRTVVRDWKTTRIWLLGQLRAAA